jgi:hypothetical protein
LRSKKNDEGEKEPVCVGTWTQEKVRYVYERRKKQNEGPVPTVSLVLSSLLSPSISTPETSSLSLDSKYTGNMIPLPSPMSLRRTFRSNARITPDRYDFSHDIAQFISYSNISPTHRAFIAFLDSVTLPSVGSMQSMIQSGRLLCSKN